MGVEEELARSAVAYEVDEVGVAADGLEVGLGGDVEGFAEGCECVIGVILNNKTMSEGEHVRMKWR